VTAVYIHRMAKHQVLLEGFQQLYSRLYNPKSGCPDVELGHVTDVMTDLLVEAGIAQSVEDPASQWVLANVTLFPGSSNPAWLAESYAERHVKRYVDGETDEQGYPKQRPYEDIDADETQLKTQAKTAISHLVDNGKLTLTDGKLTLTKETTP